MSVHIRFVIQQTAEDDLILSCLLFFVLIEIGGCFRYNINKRTQGIAHTNFYFLFLHKMQLAFDSYKIQMLKTYQMPRANNGLRL